MFNAHFSIVTKPVGPYYIKYRFKYIDGQRYTLYKQIFGSKYHSNKYTLYTTGLEHIKFHWKMYFMSFQSKVVHCLLAQKAKFVKNICMP